MTLVHACPPDGSSIMPCCGRDPLEVPDDRMALDPELVTCPPLKVAARWSNGMLMAFDHAGQQIPHLQGEVTAERIDALRRHATDTTEWYGFDPADPLEWTTMAEPYNAGNAEPGPPPPQPGTTRTEVRLSLTTAGRAKADDLARRLGARSGMTIVAMLLAGELASIEGRLDADGAMILRALYAELTAGGGDDDGDSDPPHR